MVRSLCEQVISRYYVSDRKISSVKISSMTPVRGGDCSDAYKAVLTDGQTFFVKTNSARNYGFFECETQGLDAIRSTGAISVPGVIGAEQDSDDCVLVMELLESGQKNKGFWEIFGQQLALMHRADASPFVEGGRFGFMKDNYIGAGKQVNTPHGDWISFFRDCRLEAKFLEGAHYFDRGERRKMLYLLDHLDEYLIEPAQPSLLHGDLWGGNFMTGPDGLVWLIDPAVYVGHQEADLAMTELFGGFAPEFYVSYKRAAGLEPGYRDRRDLYNLYHLLNHLVLFGEGYLYEVLGILRHYAR